MIDQAVSGRRRAELVLGPILRHVGTTDATIWVETSQAAEVEVRAGAATASERTFQVAGHHYAIVAVTGLRPGTADAYGVRLDGELVWPQPDDAAEDAKAPTFRRPASRIRTLDPSAPVRIAFGSCREPVEPGTHRAEAPDVLVAFAERIARAPDEEWPTALLMLGDQVYADEPSPAMRDYLRTHRDVSKPPHEEVATFEEYTELYREAWTEPSVRWLFSTVPVSMIFDDHDVRDDWNTSASWRRDMAATGWWEERIAGGLMSYWIYQHLGNLTPALLATNDTLRQVRAADDGAEILRAFALQADAEADGAPGTMWSYRRDLGRVRIVVIDSRCGRVLVEGRRAMVSDAEFDWIEAQVEDGDYDHLIVGTSLPWLLPRALHEIESWDEVIARPRHGRVVSGLGEWLRRSADLEHWAAFRASFDRLSRLFGRIGRGEHGATPPSTICVLSGDVHHTYVAIAAYPDPTRSRVVQITCSPLHNSIPRPMKLVFHIGWSKIVEVVMKGISRLSGVPSLPIHWTHPTGPHFGNALAEIRFDGPAADLRIERARPPDEGHPIVDGDPVPLEPLVEIELSALPSEHA